MILRSNNGQRRHSKNFIAGILFVVVYVIYHLIHPVNVIAASGPDIIKTTKPAMHYKVVGLNGQVYTRTNFSPRWIKVSSKTRLYPGDIIQVSNGASIKLAVISKVSDTKNQKPRFIELKSPIVTRLSEDLIRPISTTNLFTRSQVTPESKAQSESVKWTFDEAWQRTLLILQGGFKLAPNNDSNESNAAATIPSISLVAPHDGAYFRRSQSPVEIDFTWEPQGIKSTKTKAPSSYNVYVWKSDLPRPGPTASTSGSSYHVSIPKSGDYQVQVESADGSMKSAVRRVFIEINDNMESASSTVIKDKRDQVTLASPLDGQSFVSSQSQVAIRFSWNPLELSAMSDDTSSVQAGFNPRALKVKVKRDGKIFATCQATDDFSCMISLPAGRYTWSVFSSAFQLSHELTLAEEQSFEISSAPKTLSLNQAIQDAWKANKHVTITLP